MLEKGIILELKEEYAIALKPGGEMIRIRRKDGLQVGQQVYLLPEDYYTAAAEPKAILFPEKPRSEHSTRRRKLLQQISGIAATIALVTALALYPGFQTVYAVASFDGEQDLQLELDSKSRIIKGYSYGDLIPEEELRSLKGKKLDDVGDQLIAIVGKGPVLIGYASHDEDANADAQAEELLRQMFSNCIIVYLSGNGEDIERAESAKTSLGFHLAEEAVEEDDSLSDLDFENWLNVIRSSDVDEEDEDDLEDMADRVEELHEEHKEQNWTSDDTDDDEDDNDDPEEPEPDEDEESEDD